MRRLRSKLTFWILGALLAFAAGLTLALNILLAGSKKDIIKTVNAHLNHRLSIQNAFFLFPNIVVFQKAALTEKTDTPAPRAFILPTIVLKLSLADLVKERRLLPSSMTVYEAKISYPHLNSFLRDNQQVLITFFENLPEGYFRIHLAKATLDLAQTAEPPDEMIVDAFVTFKGDALTIEGMLSGPDPSSAPLRCNLVGLFTPEGFLIDQLTFKRENTYLKLWGSFRESLMKLSGFALIDSRGGAADLKAAVRKFQRRRSLLRNLQRPYPIEELAEADIYLFDINCLAQAAWPRVRIERLDMTINNMPVHAAGDLVISAPLGINMTFSFEPRALKSPLAAIIEKADIKIAGQIVKKVFEGESSVDLDFAESAENRPLLFKKFEAGLKEIRLSFDHHERMKMHLGKASLTLWSDQGIHNILLDQVGTSFNLPAKELKIIEIHSPFYEGLLDGRIWIEPARLPWRITAAVTLDDVNADKLDALLIHFAKVSGRLSGRISLSSDPHFTIQGGLHLKEGHLKDYEFFKWLAQTFRLPSLREIDFHHLSTNFAVTMQEVSLKDILLDSPHVRIQGFFNVNKDNFVSSSLALAFSKTLLHESPKFRPILRIFDQDTPFLIFDFQLSGKLHAMNFQWLPSAHKEKIQDRIPDFIERKIEENIGEMIEPVTPQ